MTDEGSNVPFHISFTVIPSLENLSILAWAKKIGKKDLRLYHWKNEILMIVYILQTIKECFRLLLKLTMLHYPNSKYYITNSLVDLSIMKYLHPFF